MPTVDATTPRLPGYECPEKMGCRRSVMAPRTGTSRVSTSRNGFTLIELLVTMALIVLILTVLAEAFVVGLDSLGKLKAIGDMSDRMRAAANHLRRDLGAEHFHGSFRLSDARFGNKERPAVGFFMIK